MSPIYSYRCDCGHTQEEIRCIKDRDKKLNCKCGVRMRREQTPVMGFVKNPAVPRRTK